MTNLVFANFKAPGVRIAETTEGYRALEIVSHQTCYVIGSSTLGDFLKPTQVSSLADFTNVFEASPSEASVKLYFRNDPQGICYFVRTPIAKRFKVSFDTVITGAYTLTLNGTAVTYTAASGATTTTIASGALAGINTSSVASKVTAEAGTLPKEVIIRSDNPLDSLTVVATGSNMVVTDVTPVTPTATDYIYAIENSFDYEDDWSQGFLVAPEAFQTLSLQSDRLAVGLAMEALVSSSGFDWVALIDAGSNLTTAQAKAEGLLYSSPQGHSGFYFPYIVDLDNAVVPPSAGIAGLASRRFKTEGFFQPFAGSKFPLLGCKDVVTKVSTQEQEELNPLGVNVIRNLRNKGVVVWAMRTRSSDEFYRLLPTRVVMNVLNGTLRKGFDNQLFSSVDGFGIYLNSIAQTANNVCRTLWRGKALFGASEAEAWEVVCDFTNNIASELEAGNVLVEVYAVPAPAAERVLINTIRVSIGYLPRNNNSF